MRFFRGMNRTEHLPPPPPSPSSASVAKQRLKVVLVTDQMPFPPGLLAAVRADLVDVLSRRLDVDPYGIEVTVTPGAESDQLTARIPIRRASRSRR